jgi:hypothetical protein
VSTSMFHLKPAKHQSEDVLTLLLGADQDAWSQWLQRCDERFGTVEEEWARVMGNVPVCTQADILKAKAQHRAAKNETQPAHSARPRAEASTNLLDTIYRFEGVQPAGHEKWMAFCQAHGDGRRRSAARSRSRSWTARSSSTASPAARRSTRSRRLGSR